MNSAALNMASQRGNGAMSSVSLPMPPKRPRNNRMFYFLLILSVSYWYCLPVTTQSFFMYSEIRGYDILLLILSFLLLTTYKKRLRAFFRKDKPGRWILRFSTWASVMSLFTAAMALYYNRFPTALITAVFLAHLWGFVLGYAAIRIFVQTRRQCFMLLDVFLLVGTVQGLIICLQALGMLPLFWGELYSVYGKSAFSGTLGPNRQLPGHTMLLVFGVAAAYWRNAGMVGLRRLILASAAAVTALAALGMSGSRTAWAAFLVFVVIALIGQRPQAGLIVFVLIVAICVVAIVPASVNERISEVYEGRLAAKLERGPQDVDAIAKFQKIDSGRYRNWMGGITELIRRPWLVPFGGGFNNYRWLIFVDVSAHNMYITLIAEVGLIGLYLYLKWLGAIWRESSSLIKVGRKAGKRNRRIFLPVEMRALLLALMVSLFAGEILYTYRPGFAFLGMFLFLVAVLNNRLLVFGNRQQTPMLRARHRLLYPGAEIERAA